MSSSSVPDAPNLLRGILALLPEAVDAARELNRGVLGVDERGAIGLNVEVADAGVVEDAGRRSVGDAVAVAGGLAARQDAGRTARRVGGNGLYLHQDHVAV